MTRPGDKIGQVLFGKDRVAVIGRDECMTCDGTHVLEGLRDDIDHKEYNISGMCQSCQDEVFGG